MYNRCMIKLTLMHRRINSLNGSCNTCKPLQVQSDLLIAEDAKSVDE
jgi:hypothetical protein